MVDERLDKTSVYLGLQPRCTRLFKLDPGEGPLSGVIAPLHLFHSVQNNDNSKASSWGEDLRNLNVFDEASSHKTFILWNASAGYDALSYSWNNAELVDDLHLRRYQRNKYDFIKRSIVPTGKVIARTTVRIAEELQLCLLELRRRGYRNWLWVDAICMNQEEIRKHVGVPAASADVQGMDEFGHHVPLLSDIYGCAKQTVLWIGQLDSTEDEVLKKLKPAAGAMERQRKRGMDHISMEHNGEPLTSIGIPNENDPFWSSIASILSRRWFQRLWTLQEVVIADKVMIFGKSGFISIEDLLQFCHEAYMFSLTIPAFNKSPHVLSANHTQIIQSLRDIHHCRVAFRMYRGQLFSSAAPASRLDIQKVGLHILLPILQRRDCDSAHLEDKTFGALGLLSVSSRKQIRVEKGMSCIPLYMAFAQQFIDEAEHPSDCLLNYAEGQKQIQDLPSWCPDLSTSQAPLRLCREGYWSSLTRELSRDQIAGFSAGFDLNSKTWCPTKRTTTVKEMIALGANRWPDRYHTNGSKHLRIVQQAANSTPHPQCRLHVTGVRVDYVVDKIAFPSTDVSKDNIWSWERSCRILYERVAMKPFNVDSYCRTLAARLPKKCLLEKEGIEGGKGEWKRREKMKSNKKSYVSKEDLVDTTFDDIDITESYHQCMAFLDPSQERKTISSRHANEYMETMIALGHRRGFFSTNNGHVGIGPVDMRAGDEVCVILFCPTPYIMRRKIDNEMTYVGEVFIDGLMQAEALAMLDKGLLPMEEWDLV